MQPVSTGETDRVVPEMMDLWDDTKTFLASFEQVAKACQWPTEEWAARLFPALSGEAEEAFQSLEAQDKEDYGKVKATIMRADALKMETQRQHFRDFSCQEIEDPRRLQSQVQELCHRWLRPERRSKEQILELLILEQFLASLPPDLQGWIRAGGPDTCSQAVALVEDFFMSWQQAEKRNWEEPLKEECVGSLEDPGVLPGTAEGQNRKEVEQNDMSSSTLQYPPQPSSLLPPEGQGAVQTGVKEEPREVKETIPPALINWPRGPQPSQPTVVWEVLHEAAGSIDFLGGGTGNQVKMETPQRGTNIPEDAPWAARKISQGNVPETNEEGCESQGTQALKMENQYKVLPEAIIAIARQPSEAHTTGDMVLLSKYDQNYTCKPEVDGTWGREGYERCSLSGKTFQQSPFSNRHQSMVVREDQSQTGCKSNLDRHRSNQMEENSQTSAESKRNFSHAPLQCDPGIQNEGRPHECPLCKKCFSQREHLTNHQQLHTGEKLHECTECGKIFTSRQALRRHQGIHTLMKPYKCSQCGKSFSQRRNLTVHQRIHTGEKPYKCPECGKKFGRTQCLKNHQRIHTGDKPHQCVQCGKCFNQRRYLKNHQRIHTGLKPYECPQCGKCFSMVEYLKNHQRIHTGVKPYQCSHCGKSYIQKVALLSHQQSHSRERLKDRL